jgi:hypothetical protein
VTIPFVGSTRSHLRRARAAAPVVALIALGLLGCSGPGPHAEGRGLLPPPPPGPIAVAASRPTAAFDEPLGPAAFSRTLLTTTGPLDTALDVRDVIVGPRGEAQLPASKAPLVVDVHAGRGRATTGTTAVDLVPDRPITLPAGAAVSLQNTDALPLFARVYEVWSRSP